MAWVWLLVAMLGWGLGVFLMKVATRGIDPLTAIVFNLPGYLIIGLWAIPWCKPAWGRYHLVAVVVGAVYILANFGFYKLCQSKPITVAAPLASLYVSIPILAGMFVLGERPTRLQWGGIAVAVVALVMLTWPGKSAGQPAGDGSAAPPDATLPAGADVDAASQTEIN
ncbi:MAG TPA: DMT family transporter [Phycisphaerae bacterium]|nr:DMT family transporter [Phycisphaerae bacterium]